MRHDQVALRDGHGRARRNQFDSRNRADLKPRLRVGVETCRNLERVFPSQYRLPGRRKIPVGVFNLNDGRGHLLTQQFVRGAHVVGSHHNESLVRQSSASAEQRLIDAYREPADDGGVIKQKLLRGVLPDSVEVVGKARSCRKQLRVTGADCR